MPRIVSVWPIPTGSEKAVNKQFLTKDKLLSIPSHGRPLLCLNVHGSVALVVGASAQAAEEPAAKTGETAKVSMLRKAEEGAKKAAEEAREATHKAAEAAQRAAEKAEQAVSEASQKTADAARQAARDADEAARLAVRKTAQATRKATAATKEAAQKGDNWLRVFLKVELSAKPHERWV